MAPPRERERFENLQILRLFAAAGVALFHAGEYARISFGVVDGPVPWLRMPWLSATFVPLFFAMSGFVLTHALASTTPGRYLVLRATRLYPGYWLAVGLVMIVHAFGLWPGASLHAPDPAPNARALTLFAPGRTWPGQYPLMIEWTLIYEVFLSIALLVLWWVAGRTRLSYAVGAWLAVLAAKSLVRPGYGSQVLPAWKSIWASVHLVPFLLGALVHRWRDRARRWRWAALALALALTLVAGALVTPDRLELHHWAVGLAAALTVWFLVQGRDAAPGNPLVIGGGYSYGLYLVHVPLLLLAMHAMHRTGFWFGTWPGVGAAAVVALTGGLAFGRLESWLYRHARRLAVPAASSPVLRDTG